MAHNIVDLPVEQRIKPADLKKKIETDDILVIDVRNKSEVDASGTIETKRNLNIPFPELESALNLANSDFKSQYGLDKPSGDGSDVVFHCMHGGRGSRAVVIADKLGLKKAKNLEGGYSDYSKSGSWL
ncbi:thiosulfate:glutathione sulfurtransferase-like [Clavelina lepadiformis]|uniref:thiosulfate:glutathione sulfurtransferase-like n=1 Tax=Clavelina lepadiformis TaxID=159417 RepID=UPI004041EFEE